MEVRCKNYASLTALSNVVGCLLPSVSRSVKLLETHGFLKWERGLDLDDVIKLTYTRKGYYASEEIFKKFSKILPSESGIQKIVESSRAVQHKESDCPVEVGRIRINPGFDLPKLL